MGNSFTTTTASGSPSGHYATLSDVYAKGGQANVVTYSDLTGTGSEDTAREQDALNYADSTINSHFRQCGYTVPIPTSSADFPILADVAARIALAWLYDSRGINDAGSDDKMKVHRDLIANRLSEFSIPGRLDAAMSKSQPTGPTSVR